MFRMSRNNTIIVGIIVLVLVIGGAFLVFKSSNKNNDGDSGDVNQSSNQSAQTAEVPPLDTSSSPDQSSSGQANVKEFTVTGSSYKFDPATITVSKGDTVKINFKNSGGIHDFVIDELNVKTKTIPSGQQDTVTFTADKVGTFEYYCSVGNHRAMGMVGKLTVI